MSATAVAFSTPSVPRRPGVIEKAGRASGVRLVSMAVQMPELDGLETTRKLRRQEVTLGRRQRGVVIDRQRHEVRRSRGSRDDHGRPSRQASTDTSTA